jgi:hypothetical protein
MHLGKYGLKVVVAWGTVVSSLDPAGERGKARSVRLVRGVVGRYGERVDPVDQGYSHQAALSLAAAEVLAPGINP